MALIITDHQSRILRVNPAYTQLTGYSEEEMRGQLPTIFTERISHESLYEDLRNQLKATGVWQGKIRDRRKDGTAYTSWVNITALRHLDGSVHRYVAAFFDFTEQWTAEQNLIQSTSQQFLTQAPSGIAMLDRELRYLATSLRWKTDLGLSPTMDVSGRSLYEFIPEIPPSWETRFQRVLSGETLRDREECFVLTDGKQHYMNWECTPWYTSIGDIGGLILGSEDVTSEVLARKAAEQSLRQFKSTLDSTHDAVFMFDPDTLRFFYVNLGACEQVGYAPDELLEMHPYDLKPEYPDAEFRSLVAPLRDGTVPSLRFETIHRHRDGHDVPVEVFLQYIAPKGEPARFVNIVTDISERRAAEASLAASRKQLQFIANQAPVLIALCDRDRRYQFVNTAYAALFGREPNEIIGQHPRELLGEAAYLEADPQMQRALAGQSIEYELHLSETAQGPRTVWVKYQPEQDESGQVLGFIAAINDITERKQLTEALTLRLRERETLLLEIHHRVKNNLQVIMSLLRMQARQVGPEAAAALQKSCNRIGSIALVHEYLYGGEALEHVNFASFARLLGEQVISLAARPGITLSVEGEGFCFELQRAAPCALLLNELITNALKHAFPQGRKGTVRIQLGQDADGARTIVLSDDGIGMDPNQPPRDGSLGMRLVPRLCQQLGGRIERLDVPVGTAYRITLKAD